MEVLTAATVITAVAEVCPKAPPGAEAPVNEITGYILWGVLWIFRISLAIAIGAILGGRMFSLPHASKVGVISLAVTFISGVGYLVLPGLLDAMLGKGCI